jgi:hypothetical protein
VLNGKITDAGAYPVCKVDWKLVLEALTLLGAAIAFVIGLLQYSRAQQWKRAEFLANEMKDLFGNVGCVNALTMIDWASREIPLAAVRDLANRTTIAITYREQSEALRPHTLEPAPTDSTSTTSKAETTGKSSPSIDGEGKFSPNEVLIRDCYDALLDRFDRLGSYVSRSLISPEDLRTYIGYYVTVITEAANNPDEGIWGVSLLTYVIFYHFDGVVTLFQSFGEDIGPDGDVFKGFVAEASKEFAPRATQLQALARVEWKGIQGATPE